MKVGSAPVFAVVLGLMVAAPALAGDPIQSMAQGVVDTFVTGCEQDIEKHCKDVTPGEQRILACLYAYQDKLSTRCEYALYDSAAQLERAVNALSYVANECREDLQTNCSSVQPGEGRLLECIKKNDAKVSTRCKQAISDVGLK
ncbi:MAG: cysteine rich repeat-containing protein [bacterium]